MYPNISSESLRRISSRPPREYPPKFRLYCLAANLQGVNNPNWISLETKNEIKIVFEKISQEISVGSIIVHYKNTKLLRHSKIVKKALGKECSNDPIVQQVKTVNKELKKLLNQYQEKAKEIAFKIVELVGPRLFLRQEEDNLNTVFSSLMESETLSEEEKTFIKEKTQPIKTRAQQLWINDTIRLKISQLSEARRLLQSNQHIADLEQEFSKLISKKQDIEEDYFWDELQKQRAIVEVKSYLNAYTLDHLSIQELLNQNYQLRDCMQYLLSKNEYSEGIITSTGMQRLYTILGTQ